MDLIDSHAHLTDPAFDADRDELIAQKLPAAQLRASVEIGCAPNEWQDTLNLAQKYPGYIIPVLGVHPEYASQFADTQAEQLCTLLKNPQVAAVGEIGLDDTCLQEADKETQRRLFCQMLSYADQTRLPIVLHVRRQGEDFTVYEECFSLLKEYWKQQVSRPFSGVLHCFCAQYPEAKKALDQGLLLGINGCFTYKKNEYIRETVKKVGVRNIILETDCPYLSPQGKRGTRNDPSNIPLIAQFVADYVDMPLEELAEITTRNAKLLYDLP